MIYSYPGCFFQRPDGKYCVVFPDLDNLAAFGENFDKVLSNAVDLLAKYIYNLISKKEELPSPSDIQTLKPNISNEYTRAFLQTVNVDVESYAKHHFAENEEMTVSVPRWLSEFASKENIDVSAAMNDFLMNEFKNRKQENALRK